MMESKRLRISIRDQEASFYVVPRPGPSPNRLRRALKAGMSGRSCFAGVALIAVSLLGLLALNTHQRREYGTGSRTIKGHDVVGGSIRNVSVIRRLGQLHQQWAASNATKSEAAMASALTGRVTAPYRWTIQQLLGFTDEHRVSTSVQNFGTTMARLQAFRRWQEQVPFEEPKKKATMDALNFDGLILRPGGGLDLIGVLTHFPKAKSLWAICDLDLGRTDFEFWGNDDIRTRRDQLTADLRDLIGPYGWLPSTKELRHAGVHRDDNIGVFPTIMAVMTFVGYIVDSIALDPGKSVLSNGERDLNTFHLTFRSIESTSNQSFELFYTCVDPESTGIQTISDRIAAHLLRKQIPLAAHLIGTEYGLFQQNNLPFSQLITAVATVVVQDDSGLPFHILRNTFQSIDLWGDYAGPLHLHTINTTIAADIVQIGLSEFFRTEHGLGNAGLIPFQNTGFGRWSVRPHRADNSHQQEVCILVASNKDKPK